MSTVTVVLSSRRTRGASVGVVQASELTRPVTSLAAATSECMATLDALHVAVSKTYGPSAQQTALFSQVKANIGQEWERWLSLLQHSLAYTRNFILLCENTNSSGPATTNALIVTDAKSIESEAKKCHQTYSSALQSFASLAQRYEPPRIIRPDPKSTKHTQPTKPTESTPPTPPTNTVVVSEPPKKLGLVAKIIAVIKGLFSGSSRKGKSQKPAKAQKPSAKQLHNLPVILHAFVLANGSLRASEQCLRDIAAFWTNHTSYVSELASSRSSKQVNRAMEIKRWTVYQASMRQALSDITAYCDALTVKPTARTVVRPVSLWVNDTLPDSDAPGSSKICEAGYFEVLTSPCQFEVANVFRTATLVRAKLNALSAPPKPTSKGVKAQSSPLPSDFKPQVDRGLDALSVIYGIAASGKQFYAKALAAKDPTDWKVMRDEAKTIHSQLRSVIPKFEELTSQLHQSLSGAGNKAGPLKKNLQISVDVLRRLTSLLVDFDHFWFGVAVGAEYMVRPHPAADIAGRKKPKDIWTAQKAAYERYEKISPHAV